MLAILTILIPNWLTSPNWIEYATFAILIIASIWHFFQRRDSGIWKLGFDIQGGDWPPTPGIDRGEIKKHKITLYSKLGGDQSLYEGWIPIRVRVKHGVSVSRIDVRFVTRKFQVNVFPPWKTSFWKWIPEKDIVVVKHVNDEDAQISLSYGEQPKELPSSGIVLEYRPPKEMLANDSLWLTVKIQAKKSWTGYLEFYGPTPHGNRGYCRRKITIKLPMILSSDKAGSRT